MLFFKKVLFALISSLKSLIENVKKNGPLHFVCKTLQLSSTPTVLYIICESDTPNALFRVSGLVDQAECFHTGEPLTGN